MRKYVLVPLSLVLAFAMVSCNKAGKTGLLVVKDAAVVVHVNLGSLSKKLSWDEIKQTNWFKEIGQEDHDSLARQMLEDPSKSGVDVKGDLVFYLKKEGAGGYFAFVGELTDAAAYENTLRSMNKEKPIEFKKDGDYTVGTPSEGVVIVWNKAHFAVLGNAPLNNMMPSSGGNGYSRDVNFSSDSLQLLAKGVLSLKGDALLDSDKRFANLISEDGDVHFWVNSQQLAGNSLGGMVSMMKVNLLLENNVATATLNFEDGKIAVKGKQYFGSEMTSLIKKYPPKEIGNDIISRLPTQQALVAGVFNYPPEGVKELMKMTGVDGMANGFLGNMNYSIDEFVKANKGDIAFAVTGYQVKSDSASYQDGDGKMVYYPTKKTTVKFVAGVSVNDKPAFDKMVGIIAGETAKDPLPGVAYKMDKGWFVAGNDDASISAFLAGNNKPAYADKISGHAAGFFIDLQQIMKLGRMDFADTAGNEYKASGLKALEASIRFWQDVVVSGDVKDGALTSNIEINLMDKTTNSLKQLAKYADEMSALKKKKETVEYPMQDSISMPMVDTTARPAPKSK